MNLTRRDFALRALLAPPAVALAASGPAALHAQTSRTLATDTYKRLPSGGRFDPSSTSEVIEFFSYACPHCYDFEPALANWSRHIVPGVSFVRVPVPFLMSSEVLMRSYYTFMATGTEAKMTPVIFSALQLKRQHITDLDDVAALVKSAGGSPSQFIAVANSFGIETRLQRARALVERNGIASTPTLVVNGQFLTSPQMAGGHPEALAVVDALLRMSRGAG